MPSCLPLALFSVVTDMRLANGILFPMPITLDVAEEEVRFLPLSRYWCC